MANKHYGGGGGTSVKSAKLIKNKGDKKDFKKLTEHGSALASYT